MSDIFLPQSDAADALVGSLHTVTYVTSKGQAIHDIFTQGFELEAGDSEVQSDPTINDYLGMSPTESWRARSYNRSGALANVQIRALCKDEPGDLVRPSIDGLVVGGLSIGFPMSKFTDREKAMAAQGHPSTIGLKQLEFQSPTGETYVSGEIHFTTPEHCFLLGVQRPDVFVPVGPLDETSGIGAAAYSARCVARTDRLIDFFEHVFGYETRRDMTMIVGDNSGLLMPEGVSERFVQLFAVGSRTGYLVLLDHEQDRKPSPANTLGPPSEGVSMWSFSTRDIDEVHRRAQQYGCTIVSPPAQRSSPLLPTAHTMMLRDPDGFMLELFQQ
ncbi:MAG: VOC family protein [Pseudomonadota bacterium]